MSAVSPDWGVVPLQELQLPAAAQFPLAAPVHGQANPRAISGTRRPAKATRPAATRTARRGADRRDPAPPGLDGDGMAAMVFLPAQIRPGKGPAFLSTAKERGGSGQQ